MPACAVAGAEVEVFNRGAAVEVNGSESEAGSSCGGRTWWESEGLPTAAAGVLTVFSGGRSLEGVPGEDRE